MDTETVKIIVNFLDARIREVKRERDRFDVTSRFYLALDSSYITLRGVKEQLLEAHMLSRERETPDF